MKMSRLRLSESKAMPSISFAEREQPRMKMQEMADKNFNQDDVREFGYRSNCTPKSLKRASSESHQVYLNGRVVREEG